jgi:hypothetical protein
MVFSFMLLMSTDDCRNTMAGQTGPRKQSQNPSNSTLAAVSTNKIGRMAKQNGRLYLVFGKSFYDPKKDLELLEKDQRITIITGKDNVERKLLYLEEEKDNPVLLTEYLDAFQHLSSHGISVAFAERVK